LPGMYKILIPPPRPSPVTSLQTAFEVLWRLDVYVSSRTLATIFSRTFRSCVNSRTSQHNDKQHYDAYRCHTHLLVPWELLLDAPNNSKSSFPSCSENAVFGSYLIELALSVVRS
jgi:hypothetical protein